MPISLSSLSRLTRLAILLTTLAVAFGATQGSALAAGHAGNHARKTAAAKPRSAASGPAEGIWDSCDLTNQLPLCERRLSVIAAGGFKVVVVGNINNDSEQTLQAYAAYAQSVGMSVMWELNDPGFWGGAWDGSSAAADFSQFSTACGCTDTTGVLDSMISFLSSLPGTYGYYAADDESISNGQTAGLRRYVTEIKSVDPGQMVMIGNAGGGPSGANSGAVMGNEIYPETTSDLSNMADNQSLWQGVQQQVVDGQRSASRTGGASAFILQGFTWGDNLSDGQAIGACSASMTQQQCYDKLRYPSSQVQLELRNEVLEHSHAKLILWYSFEGTYGQSGNDTYSIYPTGAVAAARWAGLTSAINSPLPPVLATAARVKSHAKTHRTHGQVRHHHKRTHRKTTHHKRAHHKTAKGR